MPKEGVIRKAFIAPKGKKIIRADFSQAELRVLADRTQDPILLNVYRTGGDIHHETMVRVGFGDDRRAAKILNFSVINNTGPRTYHEQLYFDHGIYKPIEQCSKEIKEFYNTYKGINRWKARWVEMGRDLGYVTTRFGRRRRLPDLNSSVWKERGYAERQAVNLAIQGDVADLTRAAMVKVLPKLEAYDTLMLMQVHDELTFECPEGAEKEVMALVKETMETALEGFSIPIIADVASGVNWGECK
jgi:DNA polymerase-1